MQRLEITPEQALYISFDLSLSVAFELGDSAELVNLAIHIQHEVIDPVIVIEVRVGLNQLLR